MRAAAALVACVVVVAAGCGGGGEAATTGPGETGASGATGATGATGGGTESCTEQAGEVVDLLPIAQRGCNEATIAVGSGDRLFAGYELATTPTPSTLRFDLDLRSSGTAHCGMSSDASALIRPDAGTDLKVLDGSVSCDVPGAARFAAPGANVDVTGTLLSFTAEGDATTIRLYEGTIDIHSTADGSVQHMGAPPPAAGETCLSASQAVVTTSEPMQQTAYAVDSRELATTAIVKLRVGLVPPGALEGLAAGMSESKATVVTATEDQRKVLLARNLVGDVPLVTAAAIRQPPVEQQPIQPGETVLGVGAFPALLQTFCRVRGDVPDARLLYTPWAFSGGGGESTDTGTTSTESDTTSTDTGTDTTGTAPP